KLAPLGLAGSGPIPEGTVLPLDPIAAIHAGNYLRVPVLAGNARDEAKLFPTFLTLLGGPSGRLVSDAQLFSIQFNYDPDAAPQITIEQWLRAFSLPVTTPGTGFNARTDLLNSIFFIPSRDNVLNALSAQQVDVWYYRFDWDEEPAPFNDIYGAAHAFDLPFSCRPDVWPSTSPLFPCRGLVLSRKCPPRSSGESGSASRSAQRL